MRRFLRILLLGVGLLTLPAPFATGPAAVEPSAGEHTVRGRVVGLPARELALTLVYARRPEGPGEVRVGRLGNDGAWQIPGLGAGSWEVAAQWNSAGLERVVRLELGGDTAPELPALVFAGATVLRGSVSGTPPAGRSLRVRLRPESGGASAESTLNAEGNFIFSRLERGTYTLEIVDDGFDRIAFQRALWYRAANPAGPSSELLSLPWQGKVLLRRSLVLEASRAIELELVAEGPVGVSG